MYLQTKAEGNEYQGVRSGSVHEALNAKPRNWFYAVIEDF